MARTWEIDSARSSAPTLSPQAVGRLMRAWESPDLADGLLDFVQALLPVSYLSLVEYRQGAARQVSCHAAPAYCADVPRRCYALYSERYAHVDPAVRHVDLTRRRDDRQGGVTALLYHNADIPDVSWRRSIFEHHHLAGKFSLIYAPAKGQVISLNLYRDQVHGEYTEAEAERLLEASPLILQVHRQALGLGRRLPCVTDRVQAALTRLQSLGAALTPREAQVCARIASGMSTEGIAIDLQVAASTVVTLRKRGYLKLGVADRHALARLVY